MKQEMKRIEFSKGSELKGETLEIRFCHGNEKRSYVSMMNTVLIHEGVEIGFLSGWIDVPFEEIDENSVCSVRIETAHFLESSNGGRGNTDAYSSVSEYFADPKVKEKVINKSYGDVFSKIMGPSGDADRVSLRLTIQYKSQFYEIEDNLWDYAPPKDWYSEKYVDLPQFRFADGFYSSASEAVTRFRMKSSDDMFGERYFPVLVFHEDKTSREKIDEVCSGAKSCSGYIFKEGMVIVGTRCKPHEYEDVIHDCYANGGQVPVGIEWDWC